MGAGPGGLVAAIAARRRGFGAAVYEQAPEFRAVGSGVVLHSNGMRVLDALGILDDLRPRLRLSRELVLEEENGEILGRIDYRDLDVPHNAASVILRHVLLDRLLAAARGAGAEMHFGKRCSGVATEGGGAILRFDSQSVPADTIVAADGVRSAVRAALGIPTEVVESGRAYVRGIAEVPPPDEAFHEIWGRDGRVFGICPFEGNQTFFFCTAPFRAWPPADRDGWLASWGRFPGSVGEVLRRIDWPSVNYDEVKMVRVAQWSRPPFWLVGDAAHAMVPNLGQGANSAMVDAWILMGLLAQGRAGEYERLRRRFVERVARAARRLDRLSRWSSRVGRFVRRWGVKIGSALPGSLPLAAGYHPREASWFSPPGDR